MFIWAAGTHLSRPSHLIFFFWVERATLRKQWEVFNLFCVSFFVAWEQELLSDKLLIPCKRLLGTGSHALNRIFSSQHIFESLIFHQQYGRKCYCDLRHIEEECLFSHKSAWRSIKFSSIKGKNKKSNHLFLSIKGEQFIVLAPAV